MTMKIKDRIKELRRVPSKDLISNPKNWRRHPQMQSDVLAGALQEIGFADALIAYETKNGLVLIDGHLRAATADDMDVPVLVTDLTEDEADKLLATLDPLAAMAQTDHDALSGLLESTPIINSDVNVMLQQLLADSDIEGPVIEIDPPEDFESIDDDIETAYRCPSCSYEWSGQPK